LEPIEAKSLLIVFSKALTALKIPTKAVIPMAIIKTVSVVLRIWLLIESKAILIFSFNSGNIIKISNAFIRLTRYRNVT
jgi:hypothetical protein